MALFSSLRRTLGLSATQQYHTTPAEMTMMNEESDRERLVSPSRKELRGKDDITTGIFEPGESNPIALPSVYIAIILNAGVAAFLLVCVCTRVWYDKDGTFSPLKHAWYTALTTIPASWLTTFTTTQIRTMWLRDIFEGQRQGGNLTGKRTRKARTLLGIGVFKDLFRFLPVVLSMASIVLLTTAIVGGLAPGPATNEKRFQLQVNPGLAPEKADCWSAIPPQQRQIDRDFGWFLPNGSFLRMNGGLDSRCPGTNALRILDQTYVPSDYRYQVNSALVAKNAIGTPSSATGHFGFGLTFGAASLQKWGTDDFISSRACVPNIVKNPVKCHPNGRVEVGSHQLSVATDHCFDKQGFAVDPLNASASTFRICTTDGSVGAGTIAIGAVKNYADDLAISMNDKDFFVSPNSTSPHRKYSVECTVDVAPSIGFREVNFTRSLLRVSDNGANASIIEATGNKCMPTSSGAKVEKISPPPGSSAQYVYGTIDNSTFRTTRALATGAAGLQSILAETPYNDGVRPTLNSMVLKINNYNTTSPSDYAFEGDSQNPLEDALGVVVAAVLGQYWGQYDQALKVANQSSLVMSENYAYIHAQRIGPGEPWAVIYIVPELFAIGMMITFLLRHQRFSKTRESV